MAAAAAARVGRMSNAERGWGRTEEKRGTNARSYTAQIQLFCV